MCHKQWETKPCFQCTSQVTEIKTAVSSISKNKQEWKHAMLERKGNKKGFNRIKGNKNMCLHLRLHQWWE